MATYEQIEYGSPSFNFGKVLAGITINALSTMSRGLIMEMVSPFINDFNKMNHDFMNIHMMRNAYEKGITLNYVGENAYADGNPDNQATPPLTPSYTKGNNYMEFVNNVHTATKELSTRVTTREGDVKNLYLDSNEPDEQVQFTSPIDKNSILFKTKRLIRLNKLKTIVSQFHTDPSVEYNGQIGSQYGESHGRNLLKKEAENSSYSKNGYDNPYCRVWTHNNQYDKLSKTMRANSDLMNYWPNFEWDKIDKGHEEDNTRYGDGENYDYAWRGKHNQDRRYFNSVLDPVTGLVKMTPQYRNGKNDDDEIVYGTYMNRHTKECMFSIENLAWKDYDPYSFEEALSWEQRGPFGGRIMWFPPYGLEINETASAKWQSNDFIGRGEPVYTYVNSERKGNLTFLMITDHPSSIDYASWWPDSVVDTSKIEGTVNSETDYLRYFAGCSNDDENGNNPVGLNVKPTPLTDEYTKPENPPLIEKKNITPKEKVVPTTQVKTDDKNPITVEFFVFFPNNYSGVMDYPTHRSKEPTYTDAIVYLLAGKSAEKLTGETSTDRGLYDDSSISVESGRNIGYEMSRDENIGITSSDYITDGNYIQGGKKNPVYVPDTNKKWGYRVDHIQPYTGDDKDYHNGTNFLNQNLLPNNYVDNKSFHYNLNANDRFITEFGASKDNLYSFAEVAAALYSDKMNGKTNDLYEYLIARGVNGDKVLKLIDIFTNDTLKLKSIECKGYANSQGYKGANEHLATNRAMTVINWIKNVEKWKGDDKITINNDKVEPLDPDKNIIKVINKDVNNPDSKLYRCARCIMTFENGVSDTTSGTTTLNTDNESRDVVGFTYLESKPMPDGAIWNYYKKNDTVKYYEQTASTQNNYDSQDTGSDSITVTQNQIIEIFNDEEYRPTSIEIMKNNSKYRGVFNEYGVFLNNYDYSGEHDDLIIHDFINGQENIFYRGEHLYYQARFYEVVEYLRSTTWNDLYVGTYLTDVTDHIEYYSKGDFVWNSEMNNYYECQVNYIEVHPDYVFDENDWEKVTTTNINEAIQSPYVYKDITDKPYNEKDIIYDNTAGVTRFMLCKRRNLVPTPGSDLNKWELLFVDCYEDGNPGDKWYRGDYVTYDNDTLWVCIVDVAPYESIFNESNWEPVSTVYFSELEDKFTVGEIVEYNDEFYEAKVEMSWYVWTDDLRPAIPNLVCDDEKNKLGEFDGEYPYAVGDYCRQDISYYKSLVDFSEKPRAKIPFSTDDWSVADDKYVHSYEYSWELGYVVEKAAAVLCFTFDEMINKITKGASYPEIEIYPEYECIWNYGTTSGLVTQETVNTGTNLTAYANDKESNSYTGASEYDTNAIKFTEDEERYLELLVKQQIADVNIQTLRKYIILYRILDGIDKIKDNENNTRSVCDTPYESEDEMEEKNSRKNGVETEGCDNIWVDRGDGLLIQECNINKNVDYNEGRRFNAKTGEGDWNKLRYDQEYHFYKQWIADNPLMYEKLQQKIKYFNPAFHSMTPEGFNARCTFLQQCVRQGNTKTMSDFSGKTANNLAFGRPPYCVLRLGDFYYQMIVIDDISFDYNVADGIQWDMNTEGNGVQPMLCKVTISFKFIGGGDITGPVQRLQNAMSFNYYANASFYDNRADRVEYQPTNWKTMGGAGNDKVDLKNSYAYVAKMYEDKSKIYVPGE